MQEIIWTTGLVVTIAIGAAVVGYLLASVLQGRKITQLGQKLEQSQKDIMQANEITNSSQESLKQLKNDIHQKELSEGKLQEQLNGAQATEQRLNNELADRKTEIASLNVSLNEVRDKRHDAEKQLESAQAKNSELVRQLSDVSQKLSDKSTSLDQLQERYYSLSNEHTELKTTLERKEEHFKEQMQQLGDAKQSLTKEFENLANKIFEEKGKTFTATSQTSIDSMLKPFREQIEGFQKRINEVHDESIKGNTGLESEIKKVLDIGLEMSKEASNLTSALKGDSQQRGAWGEAQLRRTLEMSGLIEDAHYEVQSSFKDSDGKQKQTDYLVKLPDGKHIIIDSKVSLNAYDRAVSAESPEEYQLAMGEHIKAVRKHIDDLASKDYTNLIGMHSPSFVLMFMPIEPAYIEALKSNKDLFEYGYKKSIVLVSHTTLIPILRTVSNLWMIERSNAEAREISEKAGDIYNQVCIVAERLSKLGGTLNTVSNHYNSTVKALAGQQGLYGKVDRFNQLSAKVSKSLPQIEPTHMDFETERLSMIVEPITEDQQETAAIENKTTESESAEVTLPESITESEEVENN